MRLISSAALLAAAAALAIAACPAPAEAAPKKRAAYQPPRYIYYGSSAPTRITVRRRSFLDPGSETKPFAQHYHDYALSPSDTVFPKFFDYSTTPGSFSRMPLPGLYDVPGYLRY